MVVSLSAAYCFNSNKKRYFPRHVFQFASHDYAFSWQYNKNVKRLGFYLIKKKNLTFYVNKSGSLFHLETVISGFAN